MNVCIVHYIMRPAGSRERERERGGDIVIINKRPSNLSDNTYVVD